MNSMHLRPAQQFPMRIASNLQSVSPSTPTELSAKIAVGLTTAFIVWTSTKSVKRALYGALVGAIFHEITRSVRDAGVRTHNRGEVWLADGLDVAYERFVLRI